MLMMASELSPGDPDLLPVDLGLLDITDCLRIAFVVPSPILGYFHRLFGSGQKGGLMATLGDLQT